ncbi:hypothetical protein DFJ58DRAFT_733130 [Suillus subalutaceus]|uniref:uncharacterized protein n=1 Tax=Suillus subalutaceus TaxID=48586 RepID=UPI001B868534|nr:uncharacterized protein DFJ58DRAFT_733130 [Suillus subalutaceus]KAG1839912.1 hypothetical protein DFJ58DRAFT_733130 [Suillus subalutaceus]
MFPEILSNSFGSAPLLSMQGSSAFFAPNAPNDSHFSAPKDSGTSTLSDSHPLMFNTSRTSMFVNLDDVHAPNASVEPRTSNIDFLVESSPFVEPQTSNVEFSVESSASLKTRSSSSECSFVKQESSNDSHMLKAPNHTTIPNIPECPTAPNFALDLAHAYGLSYVSSGPLTCALQTGHSSVVSESTMTPTPPPMSSSLVTPPVLKPCQPICIGSNKPTINPRASVPCKTTCVQEDVLTTDQSFEEEFTKPYGLSSSSQSTSYNPPIPQVNDNSYVPLTPVPTPALTPIQTEGPSLPMDQDDDYITTPPYASPYASPYATPPYIPYSPPSPPETHSSSRIMRELYNDMEPNGNTLSPEYYVPPPHRPSGDPCILATTSDGHTPGSNTPPPSYISSFFNIEDPSTTTLPSPDKYQMLEDYLVTNLPTLSDTHTPTIEHCAEAFVQFANAQNELCAHDWDCLTVARCTYPSEQGDYLDHASPEPWSNCDWTERVDELIQHRAQALGLLALLEDLLPSRILAEAHHEPCVLNCDREVHIGMRIDESCYHGHFNLINPFFTTDNTMFLTALCAVLAFHHEAHLADSIETALIMSFPDSNIVYPPHPDWLT